MEMRNEEEEEEKFHKLLQDIADKIPIPSAEKSKKYLKSLLEQNKTFWKHMATLTTPESDYIAKLKAAVAFLNSHHITFSRRVFCSLLKQTKRRKSWLYL